MDPAMLIPTPDPIPVSWGWFQFLLTLTFFLHILVMNVMLGTAIIALTKHFGTGGKSFPVTREISNKLPFTIAFAVNFGIAPLLFVQVLYGHFIYASSVLMGSFWLSIFALLIAAYYAAYIYSYQYDKMHAGRVIAVGFSALVLLLIGFFLSNNMTLMLHPEYWARYFDRPNGLLLNLSDPTIFPRYLHFVISAIAVGGLSIALFYKYKEFKGDEEAGEWIQYGCNWFAYSTMVNFAIGFWFFGSLPEGVINIATMVGKTFSLFLIAGIVTGALSVIHALRAKVIPAACLTLGTVLLMVLMRDLLRVAYLKPWFSVSELTVEPAYSPFILFLLFFVAGLVLIGWMIKLSFRACDNKEVQS